MSAIINLFGEDVGVRETGKSAVLSPCGLYRYRLERAVPLRSGGATVGMIGVNPTVADAETDDTTIRKDLGFAERYGWGRIIKGNKFAYRATDVRQLRVAADPIGPENDAHLRQIMLDADILVACWGPLAKLPLSLRPRRRRGGGTGRRSRQTAVLLWDGAGWTAAPHAHAGVRHAAYVVGTSDGRPSMTRIYPLWVHLTEQQIIDVVEAALRDGIPVDTAITAALYPANVPHLWADWHEEARAIHLEAIEYHCRRRKTFLVEPVLVQPDKPRPSRRRHAITPARGWEVVGESMLAPLKVRLTWRDMAKRLGVQKRAAEHLLLKRLCFRFGGPKGQRVVVVGPCVACGEPHDVGVLSDARQGPCCTASQAA